MGHWQDPALTESSGMALSLSYSAVGYTMNDENDRLFVVDLSTGKTLRRVGIKGATLIDPESISIDKNGILTLADIGDNEPSGRSNVSIYTIREPNPTGSDGDLSWIKYTLAYPGGTPHNAETFLDRANGNKYVISKVENGVVYKLPKLQRGVVNHMTVFHGPDSDLDHVSDAVGQWDDKWSFVLMQDHLDTVFVFDNKWNLEYEIPMPEMTKPEGIGISKDGKTLTVTDDAGATGGYFNPKLKVPKQFWPKQKPYTPPPASTPPTNPCMA